MKKIVLFISLVCFCLFPVVAEKYGNSIIEFEIPGELEIQNETLSAIRKIAVGSDYLDAGDSFQVILQQKGLNSLSSSAFNQYCRIMISVVDSDGDMSTNDDFKREYYTYSSSELSEIYDGLEMIINGDIPIVSYEAKDTATISNNFAVHMAYVRQSTSSENKGNVHVEVYYFIVQGHYFFVSCSYRVSEKQIFAPAIEKFMSSFKVLTVEDRTLSSTSSTIEYTENQLYSQTLPWVSTSFLWPEKNISWKQTSDYTGTAKSISYNNVDELGHSTNIIVTNMKTRISSFNKKSSLNEILSTAVSTVKNSLKQYNCKITQQEIINDAVYISYEYSSFGITVLGKVYYRFPDSYRCLAVQTEYFDESFTEVEKILNSLGF